MRRPPQFLLRTAFLLVFAGLAWTAPAQSTGDAATDDPSPHSDVWLISEARSIWPGATVTVALRMIMDENWHSYWRNPGDSGQETAIEWDLPDGFEAGDIQWPYPHRIDLGPLTSYGYYDEVFLLTEIRAPATLVPGSDVTLRGRADWLICEEICLLATGDVELTLPVSAGPPAKSDWADEIDEARARLAVAAEDWKVRATRSSGSYVLHLTPPDGKRISLEGANFFPYEKAVIDHAAPQPVSRDGRAFMIALKQSAYAQGPAEHLSGVLVAPKSESFVRNGRARALHVDAEVEDAQVAGISPIAPVETGPSFAWALLFALVGGILLNLMPCVFPILSIKVLSLARQSHSSDGETRRHGLIFAAGVLVSFWLLAGLLLGLRAGGSQIGWGFQLQSPAFVALMSLLFFGIGLSLLGVFEVGTSIMRWGGKLEQATVHSGRIGSFLSGVLATIVATPCTAPLMGAALGLAVTLSAMEAMLIFSALGAGMSLPYVALSMSPGLMRRIPRPGPWMETLKQGLAFPMFATVIWLVWVFGQQTGTDGIAPLLFGLLLFGIAGWILGRWSAYRISNGLWMVTRSAASVLLAGSVALALLGASHESTGRASREAAKDNSWAAYSATGVEQYRAAGRPVFIDFTAAWCLTCQVNKRTTLGSDAVMTAFREHNVALMRADWTNEDPEITRALESHGRSGVPLYVLYRGDGADPVLLPEILTQGIVLDALNGIPLGRDKR